MIIAHYAHRLPADYDIPIIRNRAAARGHLFDAIPELYFKGFLLRERGRLLRVLRRGLVRHLRRPLHGHAGREGRVGAVEVRGHGAGRLRLRLRRCRGLGAGGLLLVAGDEAGHGVGGGELGVLEGEFEEVPHVGDDFADLGDDYYCIWEGMLWRRDSLRGSA